MAEVLTVREADAIIQTAERLQARLAAAEARAHEAEERADRIASDMDLLEKELRAKRRREAAMVKARNEDKDLDPDAKAVREVWDYYRDRCDHPRAKLDGPRFDLIKTALKLYAGEPDIDGPAVVRKAIDGAAAFPFVVDAKRRQTGKRSERYDKLELVLRNADKIESFCALADRGGSDQEDGAATAPGPTPLSSSTGYMIDLALGDGRTRVVRHDPTPLERAVETLGREFGSDLVETVFDPVSEVPRIMEHWAPCPLHPVDAGAAPLRIRHRKWGRVAVGSKEAPEFACRNGCKPEAVAQAVRELEAGQEGRSEAVVIPLRPREKAA